MKLKELIKNTTSNIWITFGEDPNQINRPDIKLDLSTLGEYCLYIEDILTEYLLEHEVYLIYAPCTDIIYVSLFLANDKEGDRQ